MITKIKLENFQSHENTELEMGRFTVLTGGSNSGKSAVLRALAGLLRNDSASDYITHGKKFLKVSMEIETGEVVEWVKGDGKNQYNIILPDGTIEHFDKVGTDVPEEVAELLGITPITMEGGQRFHLNVQEQLEPPFLVSREHTAGFAAKVFGEITSAAKIQAATNEANRTVRADGSVVKSRKLDRDDLTEELEQYTNLSLIQESLHELQSLVMDIEETDRLKRNAEDSRRRYDDLVSSIERLGPEVSRLEEVKGVDLRSALDTVRVVGELSEGRDTWEELLTKEQRLDRAFEMVHVALEADTETLTKLSDTLKQVYDLKNQVEEVTTKYNTVLNDSTKLADTVSEIDEEINTLYEQLDYCPSCGQDLSTTAKDHLLSEIRI